MRITIAEINKKEREGELNGRLRTILQADDSIGMTEMLLNGLKPNHLISSYQVIHQAAYDGAIKVVQVLIEAGVLIEEASKDGETPLAFAVISGRHAVAEQLITLGANVHVTWNGGRNDLVGASVNKESYKRHKGAITELLLKHGADPCKALDMLTGGDGFINQVFNESAAIELLTAAMENKMLMADAADVLREQNQSTFPANTSRRKF